MRSKRVKGPFCRVMASYFIGFYLSLNQLPLRAYLILSLLFPFLALSQPSDQSAILFQSKQVRTAPAKPELRPVIVPQYTSPGLRHQLMVSDEYKLFAKVTALGSAGETVADVRSIGDFSFANLTAFEFGNLISRRLPLQLSAASLKFDQFDEIWLDTLPTLTTHPCSISFGFMGKLHSGENSSKPFDVKVHGGTEPVSLKSALNVGKDNLKPFDFTYLISRWLDLNPESYFRFRADGERTMIQKRMSVLMSLSDELRLTSIYPVHHVNLRVRVNGVSSVVEFPDLASAPPISDGSVRLRFDQKFPDGVDRFGMAIETIILEEIFVSLDVAATDLKNNLNVLSLQFYSEDVDDFKLGRLQVADVKLYPELQNLSSGWVRQKFSLRALRLKGHFVASGGYLSIGPSSNDTKGHAICNVREVRGRLVRKGVGNVPSFVTGVENFLRKQAIFDIPGRVPGKFAAPGVIAWLPVSNFAPDDNSASVPLRLELDSSLQVSSHLARLRVDGLRPSIQHDGDSLRLIAQSISSLRISWSLNKLLPASTYFVLQVPHGSSRLKKYTLIVIGKSGQKSVYSIYPNMASQLNTQDLYVESVELIASGVDGFPVELKLDSLGVFHPQLKTVDEIFTSEALPRYKKWNPVASDIVGGGSGEIDSKPGRLFVESPDSKRLRFKASFLPSVHAVNGITFRLTRQNSLQNNNLCQIELKLNWDHGSTFHRLCDVPNGTSQRVLISELDADLKSLGALVSIDWSIETNYIGPESGISFDYEVDGFSLETPSEILQNMVFAMTATGPIIPAMRSVSHADFSRFTRTKNLPIDTTWIPKLASPYTKLSFVPNQYFNFDHFYVQPVRPQSRAAWLELTKVPVVVSSIWSLYAFSFFFLLLILAWLSQRLFKRYGFMKAGFAGSVIFGRTLCLRTAAFFLHGMIARRAEIDIFLCGALTIGCFGFAARVQTAGELFVLILSGAIVLSCLAARYRADWNSPFILRSIFIDGLLPVWISISIGCFTGLFKDFGVSAYTLLSYLPLGALIFGLWPLWIHILSSPDDRSVRRVFLLVCGTLVLFVAGSLQGLSGQKQFLFSFGSIGLLFLIVSMMRYAQPWVREREAALSACLFSADGTLYLAASLVGLAATSLFLSFSLDTLADQFAMMTYFGLSIGTTLKIISLKRL